jgi:SAM-dependent methyltransferase
MNTIDFPTEIPIKGRVRVCLELLREQKLKGKIIIDIGSSFGWLEKEISKDGAKKIIGIEPNISAVKFSQRRVKNAEFIVGDALNTTIENNFADIVVLFDVLEHIPKKTELLCLKEANRILKKGGVLLLSTPYDNLFSKLLDPAWYFGHRHYSYGTLRKFLNESGFNTEYIETKGNLFSCLYLIWFYMSKKIFSIKNPVNKFMDKYDDLGFNGKGLLDVFLKGVKK